MNEMALDHGMAVRFALANSLRTLRDFTATKPVGNALSITCPQCDAPEGSRCGTYNCKKRARAARWVKMLEL